MTSKWRKSPAALIEKFLASTESLPNTEPRKMFGYPCCFVNGNMFTGLHQESWIVRLDKNEREELMAKFDAVIFEPTPGRAMTQYVALPEAVLADKNLLGLWLNTSLAFAASLPRKQPKNRTKRSRS